MLIQDFLTSQTLHHLRKFISVIQTKGVSYTLWRTYFDTSSNERPVLSCPFSLRPPVQWLSGYSALDSSSGCGRLWVRIPAWPVAALVSLSKTLNHNCLVLRNGRLAVDPVWAYSIIGRKITQNTYCWRVWGGLPLLFRGFILR